MPTTRIPEVLTAAIEFPCDWCDQSVRKGAKYAVHINTNRAMSYVHYPWCYNDVSGSDGEIQSHA
jgi:hypothetical protein